MPAYRLSRRAWAATVILVLAGVLASLPASPARAQSFGDAVVAQAATHYGAPYRWGGSGPNTFDCSGLVMVVFGHFGVRLPHYTVDQYAVSRHIPQILMVLTKRPGWVKLGASPATDNPDPAGVLLHAHPPFRFISEPEAAW